MEDRLSDLVGRAQRGDESAFAQLVSQTQARVYNLAYGILRSREEAEDTAQEIYLRVWRALPGFRGEARFTTWLYRIATNLSLNRRRHLRTRLREVENEGALDRIASPQAGPASEAMREDRRTWLWRAVSDLPNKYRVVITLFYQQQLSYDEVAEMLSLPLGTVKSHLNRARRALAKALSRQNEESDPSVRGVRHQPEVEDVTV